MKLHTIDTGLFKLDGGAMFGVVPKTIWQKSNPADANNLCSWAMRCLLIEDGDRLTLIDTGIGDKQDEKFFGHYYLHGDDTLSKSLSTLGFATTDITDVILTHLHFDHCGGAIVRKGDQLRPAFENATYWSNEQHWNWATNPNDRERASFLKDNILPIQESGQLKFIEETPGVAFQDGVQIRYAFGHTDAMMLPQIQYKGRTIVYMADLLPSTGHLPLPYVMAYDMFPLKTMEEKKIFLKEAVDNNYILFLEHDNITECCTLQDTEKGVRVKDTFNLSDI
jgi:glyoxylase-like metal-dependent hydrolase (beta-lactamase superfamily II)